MEQRPHDIVAEAVVECASSSLLSGTDTLLYFSNSSFSTYRLPIRSNRSIVGRSIRPRLFRLLHVLRLVASPPTLGLEDGSFVFSPSVGGLATGLSSLHGGDETIWVGWSGLQSDDLTESESRYVEKELLEKYNSVSVPLSSDELGTFYYGFCNNIVWPLFHYFLTYVEYDKALWDSYVRVNRIFADKVLSVARDGDFIWVHDYQLMLLPSLLKERLPDSTIGFFLHIPFPSYEIFRLLPWREDVLMGLLGADLVGFHTYDYARHFLSSVRRLVGLEHSLGSIRRENRIVKVDVFPMGIDYEKYSKALEDEGIRRELRNLTDELQGKKVILSVDRLDYSKGIPQRLRAFLAFLENYPEYLGKVTLIIVVSPSRTKVPQYMELKRELDELVGVVNGQFGRIDWTPVQYFYRTFDFAHLTALYALSDLLLVTPLRDGMNLITKEYIATHSDMRAVVVLSETAGAARELGEALIVNPTNIDEIAAAIRTGLEMTDEEKIETNTAMHRRLKRYDVHYWANDFMEKLDAVANDQRGISARRLTQQLRKKLIEDYRNAAQRLILLGYDGSLVQLADRPGKAAPDSGLISLLQQLGGDPRNAVVIVSGRSHDLLERWFAGLEIGLASGHGAWFRNGPSDEWQLIEAVHGEWKETIEPIMERYVDRTPGTFIEEKDLSLAWHYRRAEPELAAIRVAELKDALLSLTSNFNLSVLEGKQVLEVKNAGINKGRAATLWTTKHAWDFILAVGDDWTDEDMFSVLPEAAYTIKVGLEFRTRDFSSSLHPKCDGCLATWRKAKFRLPPGVRLPPEVRLPPGLRRRTKANRIPESSYPLDFNLDDITVTNRTYTARGAGQDEVSLFKGEISTDEGNRLRNGKNHVPGVGVLDHFPILPTDYVKFLRVPNQVMRNNAGADGTEGVERFSAKPSGSIAVLDVSLTYIVRTRVAKDDRIRVLGPDISAPLPDNNGKLSLVVRSGHFKIV